MVSSVPQDADGPRRFVLGYRPPLDGVRGFALISIMVFHSFLNTTHPVPVPGSFVSVDMFFALSGFLITTILAQEWLAKDRIDLLAFYIRRGLRLFPALVVFLGLMAVLTYLGVLVGDMALVRRQILWTAFYGQNWHEVFEPGLTALSHAWTLSVEEQFYVLWPLVLWGLLALRRSRVVTVGLVVALAVGSAVVMAVVGERSGVTSNFHAIYGTDARAHGLLFGSALGLAAAFGMFPRAGRRWPAVVGWLGAAYFAIGFATFDVASPDNTRGVYAGAGLATVMIIFAVVHAPGGWLARGFGSRPLVAAGRVSYGGYLWHLPVFYVLTEDRTGLSYWPLLVVRFVVTFALAYASFRLVERPALRFKRRFERRTDATDHNVVVAPGVTMPETT
jgi:peptidoglycan/LPS O-acetylase OafA/YrhL